MAAQTPQSNSPRDKYPTFGHDFADDWGIRSMRNRCLALVLMLLGSASPLIAAVQDESKDEVLTVDDVGIGVDELIAEGERQLELSHYDEAIQIFSQVLEHSPQNGMVLVNRAFCYGWTNRLDEATRDLEAAEAVIPDHARLDRVRGLIAIRRSNDQAAFVHLSKSLEKEPGNPFALRMRAYINQRAGNEEAALGDAEAFIRAKPENPDAYSLKANLLIGQKKRDLALAEANRLFSDFADDAYGIAAAARVYDDLGHRDRALAAIDKAIQLDPKLFYYRKLRAKFRRWDDFTGRRDDLNAALEADPNNAGTLSDLGLLEFRQHRWREAADRFSEVLAQEPKDFGVLAYRAMAHLQAGDGKAAAKDYDAALSSSSGADDFSLVCWALGREGLTLAWAIEACNRAVALKDRDSKFRANRGLVWLRLGQLEEALADFNVAIETDGRRADGYYGRALVYRRLSDPVSASRDLQQALAIDPRIGETYQQYGFEDLMPLDSEGTQVNR